MISIKSLLYIIPFLLLSCGGQEATREDFYELTRMRCDEINEDSPIEDQMPCVMSMMVQDGINYMPSYTRKTEVAVTSPEIAWTELMKCYPHLEGRFTCWAELYGYYIFSLDFPEQPEYDCSFMHIYYIPVGGDEFWYFWPHT